METLKKALYFPLASYFKFFAKIRLKKWNPRIIVITGSSGKTTTLHLVESQITKNVRYSHHANSAFGIPFDILGIRRKTLTLDEWIGIFLSAPFHAFKAPYKEEIYIVEADCDRPHEGKFLSELLNPEITVWLSSARTHSMNFDSLIENKVFSSVEEAIAYEFGYFIERTSSLVIINGDNKLITKQLTRTNADVEEILKKQLESFKVSEKGTQFHFGDASYTFSYLLPEESFYSLRASQVLCEYLEIPFDTSFKNFSLPPGRSSLFRGIKNTTLIDSTYNADLSSMTAILSMFEKIKAEKKWVVLGDMLEQGAEEKEEHEKLAELIKKVSVERIILMGPRVSKYTLPLLSQKDIPIVHFTEPRRVLDFLRENIKGEELILFKGARFLEGVIDHLLEDRSNAKNLPRREKIWDERRNKWGVGR